MGYVSGVQIQFLGAYDVCVQIPPYWRRMTDDSLALLSVDQDTGTLRVVPTDELSFTVRYKE